MTREVRTSFDTVAEETGSEMIAPDFDGAKQLPAPITSTCCEQWPVCTCLRDSKILSLVNSPLGDVFQNPKPWDAVTTPGVSYSVMYVLEDGRLIIALAVEDPPNADYITITFERWQELCLTDGSRLLDGSAHRQMCRSLASG